MAATTLSAGTDNDTSVGMCSYKKGGMCTFHLTKGSKKTIKWKEWTQKKNGLFGYVSRQKTEYVCHSSGGALSNYRHLETKSQNDGVPESNLSISGVGVLEGQTTALGGIKSNLDNIPFQGISGVGFDRAGGFESEVKKISNSKDYGLS